MLKIETRDVDISLYDRRNSVHPAFTIFLLQDQFLSPQYLGPLTRVADIPGRRALRSASTGRLEVPYFKLSTIRGRAFPVAASQIWNSLPETVVSASFQH